MKYILLLTIAILNIYALDAFITPNKLKKALSDDSLIILDVDSLPLYKQSHIDGAIHVDVKRFTAKKNGYLVMASNGTLQNEIRDLGIDLNSTVVIYSHNSEAGVVNSSFLALVLIYSGVENISILDGGYMAWVFQNELLTSTKSSSSKKSSSLKIKNKNIFVDLEYINNNIGKVVMLDSRSHQHYYGTKRSHGVKSIGHIPKASSSFYKDKFLTDLTLREDTELDEIFRSGHELKQDDEIIIYGDSIISASMNWYILYKKMGFKKAKIYEASFTEWGNSDKVSNIKYKWE